MITDFDLFKEELKRDKFRYTVPDFRINSQFDKLYKLPENEKENLGKEEIRLESAEGKMRAILNKNGIELVCNTKYPYELEVNYKIKKFILVNI